MSCCCLNLCCVLPLTKDYYCSKRSPNFKLFASDKYKSPRLWMKGLDEGILISALNIPGTHDTMALQPYYGLSVTVCQRWRLIDQLNSGIRFLDIRVKEDCEGLLPIYHYLASQNSLLEKDVIDVCEQFLHDNPSEVIILMMRIEAKEKNAPSISEGFEKIISKHRKDLFTFNQVIPSIGQVRGKIWVWPGNNWKFRGFSIKTNQTTGVLIRQDYYKYSIQDKQSIVGAMSDQAYENMGRREMGDQIYLNQINGSKWNKWPSVYAAEMNQYIYENDYLNGIVVLDFPGERILKKIMEGNFPTSKYTPISTISSRASSQHLY